MTSADRSIGEAARESGVKVSTIRYYEDIGLLAAAPRTQSNRRRYDHDAVQRLSFIRHARELGFDVAAIRTLITMQHHPSQSCERADAIAAEQLADTAGTFQRSASGSWMCRPVATPSPAAKRPRPSRLPSNSMARPERDWRTAHSSSGS